MQGFSYTLYLLILFPVWFVSVIMAVLLERSFSAHALAITFPVANIMIYFAAIATIIAQFQIAKAWVAQYSRIEDQLLWKGWFIAWSDPKVRTAIGAWTISMGFSMIFPPALLAIANYACSK